MTDREFAEFLLSVYIPAAVAYLFALVLPVLLIKWATGS